MTKLQQIKITPAGKLAEIIGNEKISYTQITKKVTEYAKSHNLVKDGKYSLPTLCDGKSEVTFKELLKYIYKPGNIIK